MQPKLKINKTLVAAALLMGMSNASMAATDTYTASASTISQVQIEQLTAMSFGSAVPAAANTTCGLLALVPGEEDIPYDEATGTDDTYDATEATQDATQWAALTADCSSLDQGDAVPGIYKISGESGAVYDIVLTAGAGDSSADFTFTPGFGCVVDYATDTNNTADSEVCQFLGNTGVTSVQLMDANDATAYAAFTGDTVEAGNSYIALGGTITVGSTGLTAGTAYTATFDITVAYE